MSRMTTVRVGQRGFWALDDAFGVWLAYVVEEIERSGPAAWLDTLAEQWRVAAAVTELGADAGRLTGEQAAALHTIAVAARRRAEAVGDIPVDRLRSWIIVDDLPVAGGFARTGGSVELSRVLEVADGFISLVEGSLAPDPPAGAWLLGTGAGAVVMEYRPEARTEPRFSRR